MSIKIIRETVMSFDKPVSIQVSFTPESVYEFKGILKLEIDKSGTVSILKSDGNLVEIQPPYMFFEIGQIKDE